MSEIGEEEIARAIYDAALSMTGGDTIAEVLHHCEWIDDSLPLPEQIAIVKGACAEMARAVLALLQPALERAREEERERCAKVVEDAFAPDPDVDDFRRSAAAAIRKG